MRFSKIIFAALLLFIFPGESRAYINPGSGSFIFQLLLGALLGMAFSVKMFWNKIKVSF